MYEVQLNDFFRFIRHGWAIVLFFEILLMDVNISAGLYRLYLRLPCVEGCNIRNVFRMCRRFRSTVVVPWMDG